MLGAAKKSYNTAPYVASVVPRGSQQQPVWSIITKA
jgi:hypothetical protein